MRSVSLPGPLASLPSSFAHSLTAPTLISTFAAWAWYWPTKSPTNQGLAGAWAAAGAVRAADAALAEGLGAASLLEVLQLGKPNNRPLTAAADTRPRTLK